MEKSRQGKQMTVKQFLAPSSAGDDYVYEAAMCSSYPDLFGKCESNYEVEEILEKAKVLRPKKDKYDAETCALIVYCSTIAEAQSFVNRFNRWAEAERKHQKSHAVLDEEDAEWNF